jgi:hypothetical protein
MNTLGWLASLTLAASIGQTVNFDATPPGTLPPGWTTASSHPGMPPKWEVLKDPSAPSPPHVFAQVSRESAGQWCPLAILNRVDVKDGDLSVKLKPVAGREDRAGGLVWRYRDPDNYYLVRANAVENDIVLFRVQDGKAVPLTPKGTAPRTYGVKHPVPPNQWSLLKVQFRGPLFSVYFNHRRLFQVVDNTFRQPGKVGLWTQAGSVTYFDDFRISGR